MEFLILGAVIFFSIVIVFVYYLRNSKDPIPWNWPIMGMLPMMLTHYHRLADKSADILESSGGTFTLRGLWYAKADIVMTSDPANVHHITNTNFSMYPKGMQWRKRFDVFGNTLFNSDYEDYQMHKVFIRGFLGHQRFQQFLPKVFDDSMNKRLIPTLDRLSELDTPVDLERLLRSLMFYSSSRFVTGLDVTSSFTAASHEHLLLNAISNACEAIIARFSWPESIWRLQKWLGIGIEGRLTKASTIIDNVMSEQISLKQNEMSQRSTVEDQEEGAEFTALELHLIGHKVIGPIPVSYQLIRDSMFGLTFATQDTTSTALSWFFWLLSKHPVVENRISEEVRRYFPQDEETRWLRYGTKELNKMVYLHAALCETLRLYPPVPFGARTARQNDTLPTGQRVHQGQILIICTYAMGRMTSLWGEDCHEFKPERWITRDGEIKHEPSNKFFAFSAGPRICPGREVAFNLMKTVASAIIRNYHIRRVENHPVIPKTSIILHMKHGLMVTAKKRCFRNENAAMFAANFTAYPKK